MHRERCEDGDDRPTACRTDGSSGPRPRPVAGPGVWLRGNPRPGAIVAFLGLLASVVLAPVLLSPSLAGAWGLARGIVVALPAFVGVGVGLAASRPRLVHRGGAMVVRLSPLRSQHVPLEVVECFFLGSRLEPPRDAATSAGDRVRTLVMRIAERAGGFAERPTLAAWGTWSEGSVTFDGRWCEPLSVDLVRRLNRALAESKRGGAGR